MKHADEKGKFLPRPGQRLSQVDILRWYGNIALEIEDLELTEAERGAFKEYYREAGLLAPWRRPYFHRHYCATLKQAVEELFSVPGAVPRILDLGCGTGTQGLLFALLGAEVIGMDMDDLALSTFRKRVTHYERLAGRKLNVTLLNANVFDTDFSRLHPLTGVYSLFAFNMMQPTSELLGRLRHGFGDDAVIAIQDGNRKHLYKRVFHPRKVSSRGELEQMFREMGFGRVKQKGCVTLPPLLWTLFPSSLLEPLDGMLNRSELLTLSYLHVARKQALKSGVLAGIRAGMEGREP